MMGSDGARNWSFGGCSPPEGLGTEFPSGVQPPGVGVRGHSSPPENGVSWGVFAYVGVHMSTCFDLLYINDTSKSSRKQSTPAVCRNAGWYFEGGSQRTSPSLALAFTPSDLLGSFPARQTLFPRHSWNSKISQQCLFAIRYKKKKWVLVMDKLQYTEVISY